jgi:16S rRNA (cytosine967-C5)-methyltransferase
LARTPWAPGAPALAGAAQALDAVVTGGQSADAALARFEGAGERAAVRAIALGSMRWYLRLLPAVEALLARSAAVSPPMRALLVVAAHQIVYSRNAPELTVQAAVDAARLMKSARATGFVNAVLRRFVRERVDLLKQADLHESARTAHPEWLIEALRTAWPIDYPSILDANNAHPPMTLRVDLTRGTASGYVAELASAAIESHAIQWISSGVILTRPLPVQDLPGFADGRVSVQDAGAQLAPLLLDLRPGMRVLDACAAPGGKTGHLLESASGDVMLTALDIDSGRLARVGENLKRLRRDARLLQGDASNPESFWDGQPFDRILVDVPCSATGIIRRHPDIKLLRRESDIAQLVREQLAILRAASRMLAPGGRLLYSTCSILPEENEAVVAAFLADTPELKPVTTPSAAKLAPAARERAVGVQLLPGSEAGTDGFYYACLEKTTTGTLSPPAGRRSI